MSAKKSADNATQALSVALDDITFTPVEDMARVKAAFWSANLENPAFDPKSVKAADVMSMVGDSRVARWWGTPGFKEWFLNKDEWRQKQEYLVMLAQRTAEQILLDPLANANAKVQLIKFLTESVGKAEAKIKETKMLDAEIHKMTPDQLEAYIERHTIKKD